MKYEYWKSQKDSQWYWHLKGRNGEIVSNSEAYTSKAMCEHGIKVSKRSWFAKVVQL